MLASGSLTVAGVLGSGISAEFAADVAAGIFKFLPPCEDLQQSSPIKVQLHWYTMPMIIG